MIILERKKILTSAGIIVSLLLLVAATFYSIPRILAWRLEYYGGRSWPSEQGLFPVTVDPKNKRIVESEDVNALLENATPPLRAAILGTENVFGKMFEWAAETITGIPKYQNIGASSAPRFVTITPGMRKEQVADAFAKALLWSSTESRQFLAAKPGASLPLFEGTFFPGTYAVYGETTPEEAQQMVNDRFEEEVLSHYGASIEEAVPLEDALTIASIIQRETISTNGMRLISGILWNRIFAGMNLEIDSTLQYAKANSAASANWWPNVSPKDKYIKSLYNTYTHSGLPPGPIANPGVSAILAALNPIETPCLFYFNDKQGAFHCSATYKEHVALLKEYYGN